MKRIYVSADEMPPVSCAKSEQETTLNWLRTDHTAVLCTSDPTMVTKMKNMVKRDPENYKCYYPECNLQDGAVGCFFFEFPKSLLTFRIGSSEKELTEEESETIRSRLRKEVTDDN